MPGPLVGAVMIASGVALMAVALWAARQQLPFLQERLPASLPGVLWRVAVFVIAIFIMISVYMRLFPEG